jgi:hypothetical protein
MGSTPETSDVTPGQFSRSSTKSRAIRRRESVHILAGGNLYTISDRGKCPHSAGGLWTHEISPGVLVEKDVFRRRPSRPTVWAAHLRARPIFEYGIFEKNRHPAAAVLGSLPPVASWQVPNHDASPDNPCNRLAGPESCGRCVAVACQVAQSTR